MYFLTHLEKGIMEMIALPVKNNDKQNQREI